MTDLEIVELTARRIAALAKKDEDYKTWKYFWEFAESIHELEVTHRKRVP